MSRFRLLVSIVPHNKAELISNAAVSAGSFGGTVAMGRGISANAFIAALGIGDSMKDIVYILTDDQNHKAIYQAVVDVCLKERSGFWYDVLHGCGQYDESWKCNSQFFARRCGYG